MMTKQKALVLSALTTLLLITGCGGSPFKIVPVSGTVKYEDGSEIPCSDYRLKFVPLMGSPDGVSYPRVATAKVAAGGEFESATTHKYADGLVTGKHKVYLKIAPGQNGQPLVPSDYLNPETTPLTIDTNDGRRLDIRIPQP